MRTTQPREVAARLRELGFTVTVENGGRPFVNFEDAEVEVVAVRTDNPGEVMERAVFTKSPACAVVLADRRVFLMARWPVRTIAVQIVGDDLTADQSVAVSYLLNALAHKEPEPTGEFVAEPAPVKKTRKKKAAPVAVEEPTADPEPVVETVADETPTE